MSALTRRGLLTGLAVALFAPAIIRTPGLLMPVSPLSLDEDWRTALMIENQSWIPGATETWLIVRTLAHVVPPARRQTPMPVPKDAGDRWVAMLGRSTS